MKFDVNADEGSNIGKACREKNVILIINFSTDYVLDGKMNSSHTVNKISNPSYEYDKLRLMLEYHIHEIIEKNGIVLSTWNYYDFDFL